MADKTEIEMLGLDQEKVEKMVVDKICDRLLSIFWSFLPAFRAASKIRFVSVTAERPVLKMRARRSKTVVNR